MAIDAHVDVQGLVRVVNQNRDGFAIPLARRTNVFKTAEPSQCPPIGDKFQTVRMEFVKRLKYRLGWTLAVDRALVPTMSSGRYFLR
jgi:hypothetical protein